MKKLFLNGSPKRRTVSPPGLWTRRVLSISVAVGALMSVVLVSCSDQSPASPTVSGTTKSLVASEVEDGVALSSIPLASERELSAFEDSAEVIDWKFARTFAYYQFRDAMAGDYGWNDATLSERPVVVYDAQSKPELYEFIVHSYDGRALGTITTYAKKESDTIVAYMLPYVREYQFLVTKGEGFAHIENIYPRDVVVGIPGKSGEEPALVVDPLTGEEAELLQRETPEEGYRYYQSLSAEELQEQLGVTHSELAQRYDAYGEYQAQRQEEIDSFWETLDNVPAEFSEQSDQQIDDQLQTSKSGARKKRVIASNNELNTRWNGWCVPSAVAWVYRAFYNSHYVEGKTSTYLPLYYDSWNGFVKKIDIDTDGDGKNNLEDVCVRCLERYSGDKFYDYKAYYDFLNYFGNDSVDGNGKTLKASANPAKIKARSDKIDGGLYSRLAELGQMSKHTGGVSTIHYLDDMVEGVTNGTYTAKTRWSQFGFRLYEAFDHIYYQGLPVFVSGRIRGRKDGHMFVLVGAEKYGYVHQVVSFNSLRGRKENHYYYVHDNGFLTGNPAENLDSLKIGGLTNTNTAMHGHLRYEPFWIEHWRLAISLYPWDQFHYLWEKK